mmetsp:Transcript_20575/g.42916  ORF Transcript_20575/g.42916 Transcript_20575/m.42916 type:complete len:171 (+) Transcript_20575:143-655(+)
MIANMRSIPSGGAFTVSVVAITLQTILLRKGCSAFSSIPTNPIPCTVSKRGGSNFLHHSRRYPFNRYSQLNFSSSLHHQDSGTLDELNKALEFARDMDKKHGLCTEPSQKAWSVVDGIYQKIYALRDDDVEHASSNARGQSRIQNARRKVVVTNRTVPSARELRGRRYFF